MTSQQTDEPRRRCPDDHPQLHDDGSSRWRRPRVRRRLPTGPPEPLGSGTGSIFPLPDQQLTAPCGRSDPPVPKGHAMFQQHPWVLRALVANARSRCGESPASPAHADRPARPTSVCDEPTPHPSDHRPSQRTHHHVHVQHHRSPRRSSRSATPNSAASPVTPDRVATPSDGDNDSANGADAHNTASAALGRVVERERTRTLDAALPTSARVLRSRAAANRGPAPGRSRRSTPGDSPGCRHPVP